MNIGKTATGQAQPLALVFIAASMIFCGMFVGSLSHAVGAQVNYDYFRHIIGLPNNQAWRAGIALGIYHGFLGGTIFSVIFTLVVGIVSRARCSFSYVFRYILVMTEAALGCCVIGGVSAITIAALSPGFYRIAFIVDPPKGGGIRMTGLNLAGSWVMPGILVHPWAF